MKVAARPYRMTVRARGVQQTRERILSAVVSLHEERLSGDVALTDIAERAEVSVQTVLRHFGSREQLVDRAVDLVTSHVEDERRVQPGDLAAAVRAVTEHYERRGQAVLLVLAQESREAFAARIAQHGREVHRRWVLDSFGPLLPAPPRREEVLDLLVVVTDVYAWKLLRRDRRLSAAQTRARMEVLVRAVLAPHPTD